MEEGQLGLGFWERGRRGLARFWRWLFARKEITRWGPAVRGEKEDKEREKEKKERER